MATHAGVAPRRRSVVPGSFRDSMLLAAARGAGLVAVAVIVGVGLLQLTEETAAPPPASPVGAAGPTTTTTTTVPGQQPGLRPPNQVHVLILNAARIQGAASDLESELVARGYVSVGTSNTATQAETIVQYKPGYEGEAAALVPLVSDNAFAEVLPDPAPYSGTEQAHLVVILGTELRGSS